MKTVEGEMTDEFKKIIDECVKEVEAMLKPKPVIVDIDNHPLQWLRQLVAVMF